MTIVLPDKPIEPTSTDPNSILIYGPPKVGKTDFASQLPNSILLDLENGSDFVSAMKMKVSDLGELQQIGEAIVAKGRPYKYAIVDTITELEDWLEHEATMDYMNSVQGKWFNRAVTKDEWRPKGPKDVPPLLPKDKWRSVLSLPDGAGYLWLWIAFKRWMNKLEKLADHIVYFGHVRDKIEIKDGIEVSTKDLDLTGKVRRIACQNVDAVGYMFRDGEGDLKISFVHTEGLAAGTRSKHLIGKVVDADWKQIFLDEA